MNDCVILYVPAVIRKMVRYLLTGSLIGVEGYCMITVACEFDGWFRFVFFRAAPGISYKNCQTYENRYGRPDLIFLPICSVCLIPVMYFLLHLQPLIRFKVHIVKYCYQLKKAGKRMNTIIIPAYEPSDELIVLTKAL